MRLATLNPWAELKGELVYELSFPEETPSNNEIKNMHHFVYRNLRQRWRNQVLVAIGGRKPPQPIERSFLTITRECAGSGLDWDNAYGGLKPLLDCLVFPTEKKNPDGLGLIRDDNPTAMPFPPFITQLGAKRGKGKTTVRIYSLADPDTTTSTACEPDSLSAEA